LSGTTVRTATIVNLIQNASQVVETVIHEIGHQMLEQILVLSAEQVAGARTPGKASGDIRHHGSQPGCEAHHLRCTCNPSAERRTQSGYITCLCTHHDPTG
jgi:hypothetical protein